MPEFAPRAPWWGGDLQTLRNSLVRGPRRLPGRTKRIYLDLADGSGDKLSASLETPTRLQSEVLVILVHGLAGNEDSTYLRSSAAFHLKRGRQVLRLNLRGAGPSRQSCRGHYHAGCAPDLAAALAALQELLPQTDFALIGFSLGGNVVLNLLADHGLPIRVAATVSAPIEPAKAARRFMEPRNTLYHRWLLHLTKMESVAPGAQLSDIERTGIIKARSIYEFDDNFVAPRNGFNGADDYYAQTAGARMVPRIKVPTLLIHAKNDPWIPVESYEKLASALPGEVKMSLTPGGGHVGFHARGSRETWHDRAIDHFIRAH